MKKPIEPLIALCAFIFLALLCGVYLFEPSKKEKNQLAWHEVESPISFSALSITDDVAPEILLGNSSENMSKIDINGEQVDLGERFQYVLRFQNTGNDNARNFKILSELPRNVTLKVVNFSDATGASYNYDIVNHSVEFYVPNDLVKVGDPEHSIRFIVEVTADCLNLLTTCSTLLENKAYVSYQGTAGATVFSDQSGINPATGAPRTLEVARNYLQDAVETCNQNRTIELCQSAINLTAESGYDTYKWVLDSNNNGQVDTSDVVLSNTSTTQTLTITTAGNYIVEKRLQANCFSFLERINVTRPGNRTNNPLIDYVTTVNTDTDTENDINGIETTCSVDGTNLLKLYLCGEEETANFTISVADAERISWQKLDASQCTATTDNCIHKNENCAWNTVSNLPSYSISDNGEYRILVTYQNSCKEFFYVSATKNSVDMSYTSTPITCNTLGTISITHPKPTYGYQLVNVANNQVVVPFSADNGPNFEVAENGIYKFQVAVLDPTSGNPEPEGCIYESEEIEIANFAFETMVTSSNASCNVLGSVIATSVNPLNVFTYELRLDDSTHNGEGSLVAQTPIPVNTHTFTDLVAANYNVVAITEEGCRHIEQVAVSIPVFNSENYEASYVVADPTPITIHAEITNNLCSGGTNGSVVLHATGGSGKYTYAISTNFDEFTSNNSFNNLMEGTYAVAVVDSNGCYEVEEFTITSPSALEATVINLVESCDSLEFEDIEISISGGLPPYRTALDSALENDFVAGRVQMNNLSLGEHTLYVRDANNCELSKTVYVTNPVNLAAKVDVVYDCTTEAVGNYLTITLEDETIKDKILYSIDAKNAKMEANFSNLSPGIHTLLIIHENGCDFSVDFEVVAYNTLTLAVEQRNQNEITAIPSGGKEPYNFYFSNQPNGSTATYKIYKTDTYTVSVIDENDCEYTTEIFMEFIDVEMPKFFTPDADGNNDTWMPKNIKNYPDIYVSIHDRYGRTVFKSKGNNSVGWDGVYNSTPLKRGDYWYVIKLHGENDPREFIGNFTLYR